MRKDDSVRHKTDRCWACFHYHRYHDHHHQHAPFPLSRAAPPLYCCRRRAMLTCILAALRVCGESAAGPQVRCHRRIEGHAASGGGRLGGAEGVKPACPGGCEVR